MFLFRQRTLFLALVGMVLVVYVFERLAKRLVASPVLVKAAMTSTPTILPKRILCYGDSLTAGTSSSFELYPYAPYLEGALRKMGDSWDDVSVHHVGLPGWTSAEMVNEADGPGHGLKWAIREVQPSLVILLAGTNDLATPRSTDDISESILQLHRMSYSLGVAHTIAIGVPPSAYQSMVQEAAQKAKDVNLRLQNYCTKEEQATFVSFPFGFARGDEKWAPDGLHFSRTGYQTLGTSLAPVVAQIFTPTTTVCEANSPDCKDSA